MNDKQIQDIADQVIAALHGLAPLPPAEPSGWVIVSSLAPIAALIAAGLVTFIGWRNLKHQQKALAASVKSDAKNLSQKRLADGRSEWWRRTQWALESAASEDPTMYAYGTGMLEILAKSDLASPEDKALLDAVWEGTSTEMQDEDIEELIQAASEQEDLTYEEMVSVASFSPAVAMNLDALREAARDLTYEDLARMLRRYEGASDEPQAAAVDDSTLTGDNGMTDTTGSSDTSGTTESGEEGNK